MLEPELELAPEHEPVPVLELELELGRKLELEHLQRKGLSESEQLVEQLVELERCNLVVDSVVERKLWHRTSVEVDLRLVLEGDLRKVVSGRSAKSRKK